MADRFIRIHELQNLTGKSRSSIWRDERAGLFPRRKKIGKSSVAWLESEIRAWIESRQSPQELRGV